MTFDAKCYVLAEFFLQPTASERLKRALASEIQSTIENFIEDNGAGEVVDVEAVPC